MVGKKYGRVKVVSFSHTDKHKRDWYLCKCSCGIEKPIPGSNLKAGVTKSCGCYRRDINTTHGMGYTRFYNIWKSMKKRVNNPYGKDKKTYKNVTVCKRWDVFKNFKKDMYKSYLTHVKSHTEKNTTIDRVDNKKGYSPSNCRWATRAIQNRNKKNCHYLTYNGKTKTLTEWSREFGILQATLSQRIRLGWSIHDALTKKPLKK